MKQEIRNLSKNEKVAVFVSVVFVLLYFAAPTIDFGGRFGGENVEPLFIKGSIDELLIQDIEIGNGEEVVRGDRLIVHYRGTLLDGIEFDSSIGKNPYQFVIGRGNVIEGWDEGLLGMKVGGKRLLVIPPDMGYGDMRVSIIPPNSTLIFEVMLIDIVK